MDEELLTPLVVIVDAVALVLGALITRLAYRAYRRIRGHDLRQVTVGFAPLTLGVPVGGGLRRLLGPISSSGSWHGACSSCSVSSRSSTRCPSTSRTG
jgi:hypothetical protein